MKPLPVIFSYPCHACISMPANFLISAKHPILYRTQLRFPPPLAHFLQLFALHSTWPAQLQFFLTIVNWDIEYHRLPLSSCLLTYGVIFFFPSLLARFLTSSRASLLTSKFMPPMLVPVEWNNYTLFKDCGKIPARILLSLPYTLQFIFIVLYISFPWSGSSVNKFATQTYVGTDPRGWVPIMNCSCLVRLFNIPLLYIDTHPKPAESKWRILDVVLFPSERLCLLNIETSAKCTKTLLLT